MSTLETLIDSPMARLVAWTARQHEKAGRHRWAAASIDWLARAFYHVWRQRRYLTVRKLANMALANLGAHFKTERALGLPYRMKIEPTNICNTQCQLCPTGLKLGGRDKGKMDFAHFRTLIDQFKKFLYTLDLSMWGDPLICPDIYKMIRHAHDHRIWTYISSNLHAYKLGKGQAEELINSGLDMLTCSLHGATQQTFAIYQPGKDFASTLDKVKEIVATKRRLGSRTPVIQLNFVVTRFNQHEVEPFRQLAEELDCKPVFSSPSLNLRFEGKDKDLVDLNLAPDVLEKKIKDKMDKWLPDDDAYVVEPYRQIRKHGYGDPLEFNGKKLVNCDWPWKDAVINWDGSVVTCCGVFETKHDMGNVLEQPFAKLWNGRAYRMARRSFKRPVADDQQHANPCRDCPGYMV